MSNSNKKIGAFTQKDLKRAYWWMTHKVLLDKLLKLFLLLICVVLWAYTVFGLVKYFFLDYQGQQQLEANLTTDYIDYGYWREKNKPQQLQLSDIKILNSGVGRFDFLVSIYNPNEEWVVTSLTYNFDFPTRSEVKTYNTSVFAGGKKYLIDLGVENSTAPNNVSLNIKNEGIKWRRMPGAVEYQEARSNFLVSRADFFPSTELKIGRSPVSKAQFVVTNKTIYNFWEMGFYVVLTSGGRIIGANYTVTELLDSEESREIEVTWYQQFPRPDNIEVIPDVNIFDQGIFRPIQIDNRELK